MMFKLSIIIIDNDPIKCCRQYELIALLITNQKGRKLMKKISLCILAVLIISVIGGCSKNEVKELMEAKNYDDAYILIQKDKEKYSVYSDECRFYIALSAYKDNDFKKAYEFLESNEFSKSENLINEVKPLYDNIIAIDKIRDNYNQMLYEVKKSQSNSSLQKEVSWFYMDLGHRLNNINDELYRTDSVDSQKEALEQIFGFTPKSIEEAKALISSLQEVVVSDKDYYHLPSVTEFISDNNKDISLNIDDNFGYMIINNVNSFLLERKISEETFANMMGILHDYGAEISFDDKIVIKWHKQTRGYDYCAPLEQQEKLQTWMDNSVSNGRIEVISVENGIGYMNSVIDNPESLNFKFISIYSEFRDERGKITDTYYIRVENVTGNVIRIPVEMEKAYPDENFIYTAHVAAYLAD